MKTSHLLLIVLCTLVAITTANGQVIGGGVCTTNYCGAFGKCVLRGGQATCVCNRGYVGSRCTLVDPCDRKVHPCNSNGACFPVIQAQNVPGQLQTIEQVTYHCQCYSGFFGSNCENVPLRPCTSFPCLNNGICINKNNSWDYTCICLGGYTGLDCGIFVDPCAKNLCENDGVCIPSVTNETYTCSCRSGFYGNYCEKEINECEIATTNGGFVTPCQNNATCYNLIDAYYCDCVEPFTGTNCEIYPPTFNNPCDSNPCGGNTQCRPNGNSYTCSCAVGTFGSNCKPNPCASNPCRSGQCIPIEPGALITNFPGCTCVNQDVAYVCLCNNSDPLYGSNLC